MSYRSILAVLLGLVMLVTTACSEDLQANNGPLTFDQIHNTGLAALCPEVDETARGKIDIAPGKVVALNNLCFQPVKIEVEEERRNGQKEYINTKSFILKGATLGPALGQIYAKGDDLEFDVLSGMISQPTTVQLPGREQVPLLFSVNDLKAIAPGSASGIDRSSEFNGNFKVFGYRGSSFLDPRARGSETGYESAVGLQAAQDEFQKSSKIDEVTDGDMSIQIARVDPSAGEMSGSFVSYQMSSDEQGTLEPHPVRIQGVFYAHIAEEA
ncbi:MAG: photosystem II manganese-stabilizing polypeptide [Cyanobacteria bacterium J06642_2]